MNVEENILAILQKSKKSTYEKEKLRALAIQP